MGKRLAQGMSERWLDGNVLQEAAESIWKGTRVHCLESGLFKSSKTKWPLTATVGCWRPEPLQWCRY